MGAALETRPLHPLLGVEIVGVDVNRVDVDAFKHIVDAFEEHSVLLFRGLTLDDGSRQSGERPEGFFVASHACKIVDMPTVRGLCPHP
jgi:alpha-ketoglutarate-dependent taurine dioxygenase